MIRLRLLGGASLEGPDGPVAGRSAQRRRLALLALLALARRPLGREKLTAFLWPDADTERARRLLSESLYVLRRELGEEVLTTLGDEIAVEPSRVRCDAVDFDDAVDAGEHETAVALYAGPFLDGFFVNDADEFERWATEQRDRLERRYRAAVEALARAAEQAGDARATADWWRRLAARDPYDERIALALMHACAAAGDRRAAIEHARVHETLLREEFGADPDPEIAELAERLRRAAALAAPAPVPDPAVQPSDSGAVEIGLPATTAGDARARLDEQIRAALAPDFSILRLLGEGSTARVYLAHERALGRTVAVKVLRPDRTTDAAERARLEREARTTAALEHPNIVSVYRFDRLPDGEPYFVMRHVRGRRLSDRLAAEGRVQHAEAKRILGEVASALATAHAAGVIHRDVRPDNILLDEHGRALISDFGIAALNEAWSRDSTPALTPVGPFLGDSRYISPEQLHGEPVTGYADVYSLALIACEMFTGQPAFPGSRVEAQIARLRGIAVHLPPELRAADPALADLLERCLDPQPLRRPDAATLARAAVA